MIIFESKKKSKVILDKVKGENFMGFLSNLFSKQTCAFCEKEVGALGRKKLHDGNYICKECEKNCSAFLDPSRFDVEYLKQHMEYMKKQDILYKKEFETLDKKKRDRFVHEGYYGLEFADDIAMFEVIDPKADKRNYKELFRYDQIKDYEVYAKPNSTTGDGQKKYSEVGIKIKINCKIDLDAIGNSEVENRLSHPYVSELNILCKRNTDISNDSTTGAIEHLNKIFGRASGTVFGAIKESVTGTGHERQGYKAGADALKALGSLAKSKMTGNEEDAEKAKEKMEQAAESGFVYLSENRSKYTKIANEVEARAWKE